MNEKTEAQAAKLREIRRRHTLPKATKKAEADLNFAYAFTASANFAASAKALTDGLILNGFEKQEAQDLIAPLAEADLDKFELGELAARSIAEKVAAKPAKEIPAELAAKVELDTVAGTVKIKAALNADEEAQLEDCFEKKESKAEIAAAVQRVRVRVEAAKSPAERGEVFRVPFRQTFTQIHTVRLGRFHFLGTLPPPWLRPSVSILPQQNSDVAAVGTPLKPRMIGNDD
jgi:hypothetical protein